MEEVFIGRRRLNVRRKLGLRREPSGRAPWSTTAMTPSACGRSSASARSRDCDAGRLAIMALIDRHYLARPYYGSRRGSCRESRCRRRCPGWCRSRASRRFRPGGRRRSRRCRRRAAATRRRHRRHRPGRADPRVMYFKALRDAPTRTRTPARGYLSDSRLAFGRGPAQPQGDCPDRDDQQ